MAGKPLSHAARRVRIANTVSIDDNGCWLWTGHTMKNGYGLSALDGRKEYAHRVSYIVHRGPIPEGLHLDHLCRIRHCVNPEHLEAVTQQTNNERATAARTRCRNGHPLDGIRKNGAKTNRYCKTCARLRVGAYHVRKRLELIEKGVA